MPPKTSLHFKGHSGRKNTRTPENLTSIMKTTMEQKGPITVSNILDASKTKKSKEQEKKIMKEYCKTQIDFNRVFDLVITC